jgi:hypothetical protein
MKKTVVAMQKTVLVMTKIVMMMMTSKMGMLMLMVLWSPMHFRYLLSPSAGILREGPLGEGQHAYASFASSLQIDSSTLTRTGVAQR